MPLFMDKALARRLERTEGAINASFVEARARVTPECGAVWRDFDGTYAMFDGVDSPMTQAFGLGLFEPVAAGALAAIEGFFRHHGSDAIHEVSPLAGAETFLLLAERGYRPVELTTILARPLAGPLEAPVLGPGMQVRAVGAHEAKSWIETSVSGWGARPEIAEYVGKVATIAFVNPTMTSFVVEREGKPIATGSLGIHEGVALLAGASTVPEHRGLGAQAALLAVRLAEAKRRGCDVALMGAEPGSTSQRNAERNGFQVAYSRVKWRLAERNRE